MTTYEKVARIEVDFEGVKNVIYTSCEVKPGNEAPSNASESICFAAVGHTGKSTLFQVNF